jgi:hypothetical protein
MVNESVDQIELIPCLESYSVLITREDVLNETGLVNWPPMTE